MREVRRVRDETKPINTVLSDQLTHPDCAAYVIRIVSAVQLYEIKGQPWYRIIHNNETEFSPDGFYKVGDGARPGGSNALF